MASPSKYTAGELINWGYCAAWDGYDISSCNRYLRRADTAWFQVGWKLARAEQYSGLTDFDAMPDGGVFSLLVG